MREPALPLNEDDALMARLARGDEAALAELMGRWQRPIYVFVYRHVRDAEVAEELTQEAFWRLWRARESYRPEGKFSAFLFRTAARLCLDHFRRRPRRPIHESEAALATAAAPVGYDADAPARAAELTEALDVALDRLPPKQRLALQLGRIEGQSYQQIAQTLGCSVGAVEQLIFRARAALRTALAEFLPAGAPAERKNRKQTGEAALNLSGEDGGHVNPAP